jgi:hypothetical protein
MNPPAVQSIEICQNAKQWNRWIEAGVLYLLCHCHEFHMSALTAAFFLIGIEVRAE